MSVAPAPGTCCRQSWGKAELANPGAAEAATAGEAALERAQLKQPPGAAEPATAGEAALSVRFTSGK